MVPGSPVALVESEPADSVSELCSYPDSLQVGGHVLLLLVGVEKVLGVP